MRLITFQVFYGFRDEVYDFVEYFVYFQKFYIQVFRIKSWTFFVIFQCYGYIFPPCFYLLEDALIYV